MTQKWLIWDSSQTVFQTLLQMDGVTRVKQLKRLPVVILEASDTAEISSTFSPDVIIEKDQNIFAESQPLPWGVKVVWDSKEKIPYTGKGVGIAILDSGIDANHPSLRHNIGTMYDFLTEKNEAVDRYGHGTHCAGTAAANGPGEFSGVAPGARIHALKVLNDSGSGSYSSAIQALDYCLERNIPIVSMSFGGTEYSQVFDNSCSYAEERGLHLVTSAGNQGSWFGCGPSVTYPGNFSSVIAVGAVDKNLRRASFSSTGPNLEVMAPGVNIPSTWLNGTYKEQSGTSMACPHIAGVLAIMLEAKPKLTNKEAREILRKTAVFTLFTRQDCYGYGLVTVSRVLRWLS